MEMSHFQHAPHWAIPFPARADRAGAISDNHHGCAKNTGAENARAALLGTYFTALQSQNQLFDVDSKRLFGRQHVGCILARNRPKLPIILVHREAAIFGKPHLVAT
jgi:hypothetical protein